jgi:hypothetical protein
VSRRELKMRQHQPLGAAIFCFICIILLSGCPTDDKAVWKILQEDTYHNQFSYDTGSIEHTPSNTVKAMAKSNGAQYLYEIDCKAKKMRILTDQSVQASQWSVISGGGDKLLYNEICP